MPVAVFETWVSETVKIAKDPAMIEYLKNPSSNQISLQKLQNRID